MAPIPQQLLAVPHKAGYTIHPQISQVPFVSMHKAWGKVMLPLACHLRGGWGQVLAANRLERKGVFPHVSFFTSLPILATVSHDNLHHRAGWLNVLTGSTHTAFCFQLCSSLLSSETVTPDRDVAFRGYFFALLLPQHSLLNALFLEATSPSKVTENL